MSAWRDSAIRTIVSRYHPTGLFSGCFSLIRINNRFILHYLLWELYVGTYEPTHSMYDMYHVSRCNSRFVVALSLFSLDQRELCIL